MLCVFVYAPVHVYGQSDRCWAAVVIDFNAYWAALKGAIEYWQDAIVKWGGRGMEWLKV